MSEEIRKKTFITLDEMESLPEIQKIRAKYPESKGLLFHGTPRNFSPENIIASGDDGWFGSGVYVTPDPDLARDYTRGRGGFIHSYSLPKDVHLANQRSKYIEELLSKKSFNDVNDYLKDSRDIGGIYYPETPILRSPMEPIINLIDDERLREMGIPPKFHPVETPKMGDWLERGGKVLKGMAIGAMLYNALKSKQAAAETALDLGIDAVDPTKGVLSPTTMGNAEISPAEQKKFWIKKGSK